MDVDIDRKSKVWGYIWPNRFSDRLIEMAVGYGLKYKAPRAILEMWFLCNPRVTDPTFKKLKEPIGRVVMWLLLKWTLLRLVNFDIWRGILTRLLFEAEKLTSGLTSGDNRAFNMSLSAESVKFMLSHTTPRPTLWLLQIQGAIVDASGQTTCDCVAWKSRQPLSKMIYAYFKKWFNGVLQMELLKLND